MPYIKRDRRATMEQRLWEIVHMYIDCSGDLNFAITVLMGVYVQKHGLRYQNIHDAVNTCYDSAAEFKRRVEFPYEDIAKKKNGDVACIKELTEEIEDNRNE